MLYKLTYTKKKKRKKQRKEKKRRLKERKEKKKEKNGFHTVHETTLCSRKLTKVFFLGFVASFSFLFFGLTRNWKWNYQKQPITFTIQFIPVLCTNHQNWKDKWIMFIRNSCISQWNQCIVCCLQSRRLETIGRLTSCSGLVFFLLQRSALNACLHSSCSGRHAIILINAHVVDQ